MKLKLYLVGKKIEFIKTGVFKKGAVPEGTPDFLIKGSANIVPHPHLLTLYFSDVSSYWLYVEISPKFSVQMAGYRWKTFFEEEDRPEKPRRYGVTEMSGPHYSLFSQNLLQVLFNFLLPFFVKNFRFM